MLPGHLARGVALGAFERFCLGRFRVHQALSIAARTHVHFRQFSTSVWVIGNGIAALIVRAAI